MATTFAFGKLLVFAAACVVFAATAPGVAAQTVTNSTISEDSEVSEDSTLTNSEIFCSVLDLATVTSSTVRGSTLVHTTLTASTVTACHLTGCTVTSSNINGVTASNRAFTSEVIV